AETALLADFLEEPRRHSPAERSDEHLRREERVVAARNTRKRVSDMHLLELFLVPNIAADELRRNASGSFAKKQRSKVPLSKFDHSGVVDGARRNQRHATPAIIHAQVFVELGAREGVDRFLIAENRP